MKIFEGAQDQLLVCMDYDFSQDCPSNRDVAYQRFGRGVEAKAWWNYAHAHKRLRILVAYEGPRAIGQVEFLPIEYAPRPVTGEELLFIDCLAVAPAARGRGIGSGLLEACEAEAHKEARGLAVIAYSRAPFMPAEFFAYQGFASVARDNGAWLMFKTWAEAHPPEFLPHHYTPEVQPGKVRVDFFWCGQCPYAVRTHDRLKQVAQKMGSAVVVHEVNTDDRATVEQLGLSDGFYINGRSAFSFPFTPTEAQIREALEAALKMN